MAIGEFFKGTPGGIQQLPRFTPQQQGGINQVLQQSLQGLNQNNFDFAPIAEQRRKSFLEQTVPLISERFANMGGIGSSGYQNALLGAGSDLESNLAALQSQYGLQQQSQLQNLLGIGLTPSFDTVHWDRSPGFLESAAGPFAQGLGQYAAPAIGHAVGGAASGIGAGIGGLLGGAGLGALGPLGLGVAGGAGLYALINYLRNRKKQPQQNAGMNPQQQFNPMMQQQIGMQPQMAMQGAM